MASNADRLPGIVGLLGRWLSRANHPSDSKKDKTGATTGGGSDQEPVVIWKAANPLEAHIIKGRLESEGIPAAIQGDSMGEILGLSAGGLASMNVLVPRRLVDQAVSLLETGVPLDELNLNE